MIQLGLADFPKLQHVKSPLSGLVLAYEGLRLAQTLSNIGLRQACLCSKLAEEGLETPLSREGVALSHNVTGYPLPRTAWVA